MIKYKLLSANPAAFPLSLCGTPNPDDYTISKAYIERAFITPSSGSVQQTQESQLKRENFELGNGA
jgi:hypothetical protein